MVEFASKKIVSKHRTLNVWCTESKSSYIWVVWCWKGKFVLSLSFFCKVASKQMNLHNPAPLNIWCTHLDEPKNHISKEGKLLAWFQKRYFLITSVLVRLHQRRLYTSDLPKHLIDRFFWDQKPFSKTIEVLFDHSENEKPFWRYCCFAISHREKGFTPTKWTKSDVQVVQTQKLHLKTNIRRSQYAEN